MTKNKNYDATTMVSISRPEYERLMERDAWLECLEAAGVDNWQGMEVAADLWRDMQEDNA